jgi:hypothetical protein
MPRHQLRADLTEVRRLIADGRTELNRRAGDREDYWLDSARQRLGDLDLILITATARLNVWVRTAIAAVIVSAGVLATAAAAGAIGLPGGWVIAVAVVAMVFLPPVSHHLTRRFERFVEWRRVRPAWPVAVVPTGDGLTEVPEQLLLARTRLVTAIRRQIGPADWRVPILTRRVSSDYTLIGLQNADLLLCQAIDQLETHLVERSR